MKEEIFRKKSLDRIKSLDNQDDYIQVVTPGTGLLIVSAAVLLLGACVWGIYEGNITADGSWLLQLIQK